MSSGERFPKKIQFVEANDLPIKRLNFERDKVQICPPVEFYLTVGSPNESVAPSVVLCLEVVRRDGREAVFEFGDCLDLSEVVVENALVSLADLVAYNYAQPLFHGVVATVLREVSREAELEIELDDYHNPTEVTFTLSLGDRPESQIVLSYAKVKSFIKVKSGRKKKKSIH